MTLSALTLVSSSPDSRRAASPGRVLAVIADDVTRQTAKAAAAQLGVAEIEVMDGDSDAARFALVGRDAPDLVLVDVTGADDPIASLSAILDVCVPRSRVVALGVANDIGLYRRLIDIGVADYLVKPVSREALCEAMSAPVSQGTAASAERARPRIISLIGSRGGVGVTTLAVSAARTLAQRQKVVLLDLDLHFGNVALTLDLASGRGLREILSSPDRIDSLLIASAMTNAGDGLRILEAEEPLDQTFDLDPGGLNALLTDVGDEAECIIVDTPRRVDGLTRHVLALADVVGVVTDQSLAGMRDTQRVIGLVKSLNPAARCLVIANRVGGVPGEIGRSEFEKAIGGRIAISVSADPKAALAAAQFGKAFVDVARNARTTTELQGLAACLAGAETAAPPARAKGLLGR